MAQKQPYEMSKVEFYEWLSSLHWDSPEWMAMMNWVVGGHGFLSDYRTKVLILQALAEGKVIPEEVLKELGL